MSKFIEAAYFSAKKHRDQKRKGNDASPYINHPLEVANLLANVGKVEDYDVLIGAILHDTVEDTETTKEEITELFGATVCGYVLEVTDDKSLPKAERKQLQIEHAPHLSNGAKLIKLCDKISNIRDVMENPPDFWDDERRLQYVEWGRKVVAGLRGVNENLEKHFDELTEKAIQEINKKV
ncbi:MAG: HD domain-containing protein [Pyrinomonadaceae bacterium]|nr:HD domain-containing protein [Pyrinomonadaceae bacterium]